MIEQRGTRRDCGRRPWGGEPPGSRSNRGNAMTSKQKMLILSSLLALTAVPALAEGPAAHWAYSGHGGPAEWGHLSADFAACETGKAQSPIDIAGAIPANLGPVAVTYKAIGVNVVNNGHTIQANAQPGNYIELEGKRFDLLQFHFHHPSEHAISGKTAPMEVHLVHKNAQTGELAVLGVMMVPGAANAAIAAVWNVMPAGEGEAKPAQPLSLDPTSLLPATHDYYRYEGSLTTPPCAEIVHWVEMKQPITVAQADIDKFAAMFDNNARPLQAANRRFVLESGGK